MEHDFRNTMACSLQSWDQLENRRSKDDEVPERMWEAVEAEAGKVRVVETKRRREERRSKKKTRREGTEKRKEKSKERKENGSEESSRKMGNLGWGGRSGKVRRRSKKTSPRKIL